MQKVLALFIFMSYLNSCINTEQKTKKIISNRIKYKYCKNISELNNTLNRKSDTLYYSNLDSLFKLRLFVKEDLNEYIVPADSAVKDSYSGIYENKDYQEYFILAVNPTNPLKHTQYEFSIYVKNDRIISLIMTSTNSDKNDVYLEREIFYIKDEESRNLIYPKDDYTRPRDVNYGDSARRIVFRGDKN
jgi:hypothetical protein